MPLSLRIALSSLAAHKLRAVLAMLGVFLGALALTGVQHVSMAMTKKAELEVEKLGPNLFAVQSGQVRFRRSGSARVSGETTTFDLADARALILQIPGVVTGAPYISATTQIRAAEKRIACQIVAAPPIYQQVRSIELAHGTFYTASQEAARDKVVVLGQAIAQRLFDRPAAALGQQVFLNRAAFRVIGTLAEKGRDLAGTDQDEQVFMPLATYMRRASNQDWISGIYLQLDNNADVETIRRSATAIMNKRNRIAEGEAPDYSILTARDTMQLRTEALQLVNTLGIMSSSVSFAVGGLGILSIMVLLVQQRRLEIGIRRAVGAKKRDIVRQFLVESALMSTTGGALGTLASVGLCLAVYQLADFPVVISPTLILATLSGSAAIGILAGAYPAYQAAQIQILDVMRGE